MDKEITILEYIWLWLSRTDVIFSIIAAIFAFLAWLKAIQNQRKIQEIISSSPKIEDLTSHISSFDGVQTSKPIALAMSLLPDSQSVSIKGTVEEYLKARDMNMGIAEININGFSGIESTEEFINKLREKRREFEANKITELHLFIAGTITAGVIIGALYDNWIPIKLYNKSRNPGLFYEYFMSLPKPIW